MFGWKHRRQQLLQEIEAHIELETEENVARGMSPEEARSAAHRTFGNPLQVAEEARTVWSGLWLERVLQDLRYAFRSLRAVPAYTLTLVGTLALGLGCAATMLAIVDSVLLRPVALPHPEQLVELLGEGTAEGTHTANPSVSYSLTKELQRTSTSFSEVATFNEMIYPVSVQNGARIDVVVETSPNLLGMLGFTPRLGRLFTPSDDPGSVVVEEGFWRNRLHADPHAIGSVIELYGRPRTVVGVLRAGEVFPQNAGPEAIFVAQQLNAKVEDEFGYGSAIAIGRLKPGVSRAQAAAEVQSINRHAAATPVEQRRYIAVHSYLDTLTGDLQKPLWALLGGVGVLLLIAVANAANLQIGRATSRVGEISVRSALGASFGRILQQLITESLLLSLTAATVGTAAAGVALHVLRQSFKNEYPRFDELSIHPGILLVIVFIAALIGVVATVAPALRLRQQVMKSSGERGSVRSSSVPTVLVAVQIALTCILLVTSGLLTRTLRSLAEIRIGFDPQDVNTLVLMPANQSQPPELSRQMAVHLLQRFETLPGVQGVAMQSSIPFSNYNVDIDGRTDVEGHTYREGESAHYSLVSTNFVQVSGIKLLHGRPFNRADESSGSIVVLVNQAFVHAFAPGRDPLGLTLRFHRNPGETDADQPIPGYMTIVGVVENEIQGGALGSSYQPLVYVDLAQFPKQSMLSGIMSMSAQYAIRSSLPKSALANEIRSVLSQEGRGMVEMSLAPMAESIENSLGQRRLALHLVASFSSVALLLSAAGIYGVLAYAVTLRRREIGIRMALGSSRAKTCFLVLQQAARMFAYGLLPGILFAWLCGRGLHSFLYGVQALDAPTVVLVAALLLATAVLAAALPTVRAIQIDPAETLRAE